MMDQILKLGGFDGVGVVVFVSIFELDVYCSNTNVA